MPDGGEHGHVEAALGDQDLRGVDAERRGSCTAARSGRRGCGRRTPIRSLEVRDRGVERVDVREQLRDHDAVVLDLEAARERLAQLRDLLPHPGLGELGELIGSVTPPSSASSIARADFE